MSIHIKHYEEKGYVLSDKEIATVARLHYTGEEQAILVRGVYLRALVAHSKQENRRLKDDEQAVTAANERLYALVLNAVTGDAQERNARSGFARSAYSVVRAYVVNGGKLAKLDPAEITKASIREATAFPETPPSTRAERMTKRFTRLVEKLPEPQAEAILVTTISTLQAMLDTLAGHHVEVTGPEVRSMKGRVRRVSRAPAAPPGAPP